MSFIIATLFAGIMLTISIVLLGLSTCDDINCFKTKRSKITITIYFIISFIIYISLLVVLKCGTINNPQVIHEEKHSIQYITTNKVYFNNNDGYSFQDENIIIEKPTVENTNVVIVKKIKYETQWIWKLSLEKTQVHVYLSEENKE